MLRNRLYMFTYKLHIVQHPEDRDYEVRMQLASWYMKDIQYDEFFLSRKPYSDNWDVNMDGNVSKQNVRILGTKNLYARLSKAVKEKAGYSEHLHHQ